MAKRILPLAWTAFVLLSVFVLRQSTSASTQETLKDCIGDEVPTVTYFNDCDFCDPATDPTCDEHWNMYMDCGDHHYVRIISRPCGAAPMDPWNDSGWHNVSGGHPQGSGYFNENKDLVVSVPHGAGGVFSRGCGEGCLFFTSDASSSVVFSHEMFVDLN